jgi:DNA-binding MarR family transcriptional regulator/GNAT superfamily N-acetyltransferase
MSDAVTYVRQFNRTWTEVLGLLDRGLLETEFSLVEARVVFELAQADSTDRQDLRDRLGIDNSFLSRVLQRLVERDIVDTRPSDTDGRAVVLSLTDAGRLAADDLGTRSEAQIRSLLDPLSADECDQLVEAMTIAASLARPGRGVRDVTVRALRPGDLGWVIGRHGAVYADEYRWDADFEALVAEIVVDHHRSATSRADAWIAEVDGARAGCIFCCERDAETAQLRILLVERWARGLGIGTLLVDRCIEFARANGYRAVTLWTNDVLTSARRIYEAAGFVLVDSEPHHSFGHDLVGQNWELDLRGP